MASEPAGTPRALLAAGAIVLAESLGMLAVTVYTALAPLSHPDALVGTAEGEAGLALAAAALLFLAGRSTARAGRWGRTPVVLTQLLALPVGVSLAQAGHALIGVPVLLAAVAVLWLVLGDAQARDVYARRAAGEAPTPR